MSGSLRLLRSEGTSASANMAIDEVILLGMEDGSSPPTLRVYTFSPPAVTIGRFQTLSDEMMEKLEALDMEVVRRPTGGRAVVHGSDLAYSVIASVNDPVLGGSIKETYRKISERLGLALSALGIEASFEPVRGSARYQSSPSCFDTSVMYELRIGDEKIAGSAQTRRGGAFLQQGTIAFAPPCVDYVLLFGDGARMPRGLRELSPERVTFESLATQIGRAFGVGDSASSLSPSERRRMDALLGKYESDEWTQFGENSCAISIYEAR